MRRTLRSPWPLAVAVAAAALLLPGAAWAPPARAPRTSAVRIGRSDDGLFRVLARINGVSVVLVVDTGANTIVLSPADARRAGIGRRDGRPDGLETAAGRIAARRVVLDRLEVGSHHLRRTDAIVAPGAVTSLLGQNALAELGTVTLRSGRLEWD